MLSFLCRVLLLVSSYSSRNRCVSTAAGAITVLCGSIVLTQLQLAPHLQSASHARAVQVCLLGRLPSDILSVVVFRSLFTPLFAHPRCCFALFYPSQLRRFLATEVLDIKVFATYAETPAVDSLFTPGTASGGNRFFLSPTGNDKQLAWSPSEDSKLDDSFTSEAAVMDALRSALRRAALAGKSKDEVIAIVNGMFG